MKTKQREQVLEFINKFAGYDKEPEYNWEVIRKKFRAGYCYYFAHMLDLAFKGRGSVCLAAPFGHFVWIDSDKKIYDIEGEYKGEAYYFIPETFIKLLNDMNMIHCPLDMFLHNGSMDFMSEKDCIDLMKLYCNFYKIEYDHKVEKYLRRD